MRTLSPPPLAPEPPASASTPRLGAGGGDCLSRSAQYDFETSTQGAFVDRYFALGFSDPEQTTERSYCGRGSVVMKTHLVHEGRLYPWGFRGGEWGSLHLKVGGLQDLSGKTVEAYVYVDAPEGTRFDAQLAAVSATKYVLADRGENLVPGRWYHLSHTFPASPTPVALPEGGEWHVRLVDKLVFEIQCAPKRECWEGRVFVDHVSWR